MSMPIKPPFNIHTEGILARDERPSFENGPEQLRQPNIFLIATTGNPLGH